MPIQPHKTRKLKRFRVKTPGGKSVIHYKKKKPSIGKCGICKKPLKGIKRLRQAKLRNIPKSQKRVARAYGGNLCSKCSKETIKAKIPNLKKLPFLVGQLCVKIAGRDSGLVCVIVDQIDSNYVLIDGQTRRKKCNIAHLETIDQKIDIKPKTTHEIVKKEFDKLKIKILDKKPKPQKPKPKQIRKTPNLKKPTKKPAKT